MGAADLTPTFVRHADDGDLAYRRVRLIDALDLARIHVLSTRDDHVARPPGQGDEALRVSGGQVTGSQPFPAQGLRSRLGPLPVAQHRQLALDHDLARLADLASLPGLRVALERVDADDPNVTLPHGPAHAAGFAYRVLRAEAAEDRSLGLAEALLEPQAARLEGVDDLDRDRGAGREQEAQCVGPRIESVIGFEQPPKHRRNATEVADLFGLDGAPHLGGIEAWLEYDRGSRVKRRESQDLQSEGMEEWHDREHAIRRLGPEKKCRAFSAVRPGLPMRKQRTLGNARGAGRVHEDHGIVGRRVREPHSHGRVAGSQQRLVGALVTAHPVSDPAARPARRRRVPRCRPGPLRRTRAGAWRRRAVRRFRAPRAAC